jgi:RNA polymerase sigma factor (TIGR02999 family)
MKDLVNNLSSSKKPTGEVTELLLKWNEGDADALEKLLPIVYAELRRIADGYLRRERSGHTLQATALVHEAYMRLVKAQGLEWQNREQFFGICANLMRRILVDHARTATAAKRGGTASNLPLDESLTISGESDANLLLLDEALNNLCESRVEKADKQRMLRFFAYEKSTHSNLFTRLPNLR